MKQRDIELLSSYLDGQLNPSDSAHLESRLLTDRELRSVLRDLRSTRSALRQLPMRKAPRNFTLTPKMVGKNPPLPRAYPTFRFTTALATILLFITFGLNFLRPQLAAAPAAFGMGGGGGGSSETFSAQAPAAAATQAPAATEAPATQAPALAATGAPTEAPAPVIGMAPVATMTTSAAEDTARAVVETPSEKSAATANSANSAAPVEPPQVLQAPPAQQTPVVSAVWQWLLAAIALASAFIMALMRQLSINRWRRK
jgi:anti-sigma factor RsiW